MRLVDEWVDISTEDETYWESFNPNLIAVLSILGICISYQNELMRPFECEDYFFNPATISKFEQAGCDDEIVSMLLIGISFSSLFAHDPDAARKEVQELKDKCLRMIKDDLPEIKTYSNLST